MDYNIIGIDVSKNNLDICFLPSETYTKTSNDKDGYKLLLRFIKNLSNVRVLIESTGCYHKNLEKYLTEKGVDVYILNPKQVRDYAKSCGRLAKTDKIDSYMIARYGETHELQQREARIELYEKFRMLVERRRQIINQRKNEKIYSEKYKTLGNKEILKKINKAIKFYDDQLEEIDKELKALLSEHQVLQERYKTLTKVQGVGISTAYDIMADMPELGNMNVREVASLAGVAPMNCDSGGMRGQRHISGGRFYVRQALYMACLSGIKYNPVLKEYYTRLRITNNKPFKVAIVACMRKMIIYLNKICANVK